MSAQFRYKVRPFQRGTDFIMTITREVNHKSHVLSKSITLHLRFFKWLTLIHWKNRADLKIYDSLSYNHVLVYREWNLNSRTYAEFENDLSLWSQKIIEIKTEAGY